MTLAINYAVIHELIKDRHKEIKKPNIREKVLSNKSPAVVSLVAGVHKIYGKKNNSAHYGVFDSNGGRYPASFHNYWRQFNSEQDFIDLSKTVMSELQRLASGSGGASGGYILVSDYEVDSTRFLITAMLKKKNGITLSENLEPEELEEIDLNSLHQAARINYGKYQQYQNATDDERLELNYLSFVSPSSSQSAAGYFIVALGCSAGTASAKATRLLVNESVKFFKENNMGSERFDFKNKLLEYLDECVNQEKSAKLSEIGEIARTYFPADEEGKADVLYEKFYSSLNGEEIGIPVEFPVNKSSLQKYTHLKHKTDRWQLLFEKGTLGETVNSEIRFDRENSSLIINEIPKEFVEKIELALQESVKGKL